MKLKYILPILFIALMSTACSSDDDNNDTPPVINEVEGLTKIQDIINNNHTIELWSKSGDFYTGYNDVSIRIKDNTNNTFFEDFTISWLPVMQMPTMQHSCPKSTITKAPGRDTVYQGFVIYQMTNTDGSGWSLTLDYAIDGMIYSVTDTITVLQNNDQNVTSFMGSDNVRYILALIEPKDPKIAINNMKVGLYKMENMMSFPIVEDYTITLDPRMPGMGNHSSPNNTDLTYRSVEGNYQGNLSLTMTGYWVLNLKLLDDMDTVLKGEDVTEDNPQSSLYLELEF
ncbi:hypothetical protein [Xanthomarina spongicola]|uniref:YtkA-like protein n=1 Tax=Xanthomarina spongicola TaxID=570520 RepID=A0A316DG98_9FLAO|nr:hypothetical protein [Xanthomarina spongicola]PWK17231.1 hypothetical protein LX78_02771 [Xanthomarina spongicola]